MEGFHIRICVRISVRVRVRIRVRIRVQIRVRIRVRIRVQNCENIRPWNWGLQKNCTTSRLAYLEYLTSIEGVSVYLLTNPDTCHMYLPSKLWVDSFKTECHKLWIVLSKCFEKFGLMSYQAAFLTESINQG